MVKTYAKILGAVLLLIGILGFIPGFVVDGHLFGLFMVDTWHNTVHLLSGLLLLAVGMAADWDATRKVVLAFGIIYGLVALLGFFVPDGGQVFGMHVNMADDILHLLIAGSALAVALPQREPMYHR